MTYGEPASEFVLRFAKQQLIHQVWLLLLDAEFMHAYEFGILVHCGDGVIRRLFPHLFTYSADYPERYVYLLAFASRNDPRTDHDPSVLLACIRFLGKCPCPTCLTKKKWVHEMGSYRDAQCRSHLRHDMVEVQANIAQTRWWIFNAGKSIGSSYVEALLKPTSLLPTRVHTLLFALPYMLTPRLERILLALLDLQLQFLPNVLPRHPPRIRARGVEDGLHAHSACITLVAWFQAGRIE